MHPSKQMQLIWNFVDVMFMFIYKVYCFRATSKNSVNSEHFLGGGGGHRSDSSDTEEPVHFTSVVTSSATKHSGSYLARQEFGVGEVAGGGPGPGPDSGYVSHGSGGGYPKLLMQPVSSGT